MKGLFVDNIVNKYGCVLKSYKNIDKKALIKYITAIEEHKIRLAPIQKIQKKKNEIIIHQSKIEGETLNQFLVSEAISHSKLTNKAYNIFKKFIKYYFNKIFTLQNYSIDCKLSNFMMKDFILVDVVPVLRNEDYDENVNNIKYVCFNKDAQIKNIITYWLKSFMCFSYIKNKSPLTTVKRDFNKMRKFVSKFYHFKSSKELNALESGYSKRFHLFEENYQDFNDLREKFLNNGFFKTYNQEQQNSFGKIYLLGGSGVGKSYVAKIINEVSSVPILDLDTIYWKKDTFSKEEDSNLRDDNLKRVLEQNKDIVIEGSYIKDWVLPCFEEANKIFVIKSNYKLQKSRIVIRFIKRKLGFEKNNRNETISSIKSLINWTKTYEYNLRKFISRHYETYKNKIIFVSDIGEILINLYSL